MTPIPTNHPRSLVTEGEPVESCHGLLTGISSQSTSQSLQLKGDGHNTNPNRPPSFFVTGDEPVESFRGCTTLCRCRAVGTGVCL